MKIEFRSLASSDIEFLTAYAAKCDRIENSKEIDQIRERLQRRFEDANYMGFGAIVENELAGFADGLISCDTLEINEVYVTDKLQKLGIGKKLIERLIAFAQSRGIKKFGLFTEQENTPMKNLANKLGFKLTTLRFEKQAD